MIYTIKNGELFAYDDYQHKLAESRVSNDGHGWLSAADADAIVNLHPTPEQMIAAYTAAIQQHLDDFARTRNYDGILSAATYAASSVPKFAAEGQYAIAARDTTWAVCYALLAEIEAGTRPLPPLEEFITDLPALTWPN